MYYPKHIFTTKVTLDIHPDGDIYAFDKKKGGFFYIGMLVNESDYDSKDYKETEKRAMRIFKQGKVK